MDFVGGGEAKLNIEAAAFRFMFLSELKLKVSHNKWKVNRAALNVGLWNCDDVYSLLIVLISHTHTM